MVKKRTWEPRDYAAEAKDLIYAYGKENCWGEFVDEIVRDWDNPIYEAPHATMLLTAIKKELNL